MGVESEAMDTETKDALINMLASLKQLLAIVDRKLAEVTAQRDSVVNQISDLEARIGTRLQ